MIRKGWAKVDRSLLDMPMYYEKPFDKAHALLDLMMLASIKNTELVKRGEVWTSLRKLSDRWGWSVKRIQGFLDSLAKNGTLRIQGNNKGNKKGTRISLYLSQELDLEETEKDTEKDTIRRKEIKKKEKKEEESSSALMAESPPEGQNQWTEGLSDTWIMGD